jgi:phenylacetate-CoA ligase
MTEQEEKYAAFKKNDMLNNYGLIVNQYDEVTSIMENPVLTKGFRASYLYNIMDYATKHSDFYRKYSNYRSLHDFPIISKQIIKEFEQDLYSDEYINAKGNVKQSTSGSTGTPFTVTWDHRKHCRMIADMKYYAHQAGCESHERVVCVHAFRKMSDKSMEAQERDNVYNVYYSFLDNEHISQMLDQISSFNPTMVIAYGSMWDAIANYIYEGNAGDCRIKLKAIMSEAEHLKERTRKILENYFNCGVYSRYGNMECGVMAQEDGSEFGHRLNIASYYFEILSIDSDKPVEEGEVGRIVITDLFNYAMPIIRYDTGDLGTIRTNSEGKVYLEQLVGRKNDVLYTTSGQLVNQHHIVIFSSLFQDVRKFQFIQESEKEYTCLLVTDNHSYEEQLMKEFINTFGEDGKYNIKYVDDIPKLPSGKIQMTVCKLNR